MKRRSGGIAAAAAALSTVLLAAACSAPAPLIPPPATDSSAVRLAVEAGGMVRHLEALQAVADANNGNRAAGTSGYEESARYVEAQLRAAGYEPVRQVFSYEGGRDGDRVETFNILADTGGSSEHTVVVGGHLDSVRRGPGINDNASGVAAILETAVRMAQSGTEPANRVRFAFWGGEEDGLYGSEHYVEDLGKDELARTALNLNVDMAASPNGVRFVHDGDGSTFGDSGPDGSAEIESVFLDYFAAHGLAAEPTPFDGGSDYAPFLDAGIPAGGLFTGDEGTKSGTEVRSFGGAAGQEYDPCYHRECDTIENVDAGLLEDMADALVHATLAFAQAAPKA